MPSRSPRFIANGNINPSVCVKVDASVDGFAVLQASAATDKVIGVADEATKQPPGVVGSDAFAAHQNEPIHVYGQGEECLAVAGAAVTAGDWLKSNASGQVITVAFTLGAGTIHTVGYALEAAAAAGVLIRVVVSPKPLTNCTA